MTQKNELLKYREQIDNLDRELVKIIARRFLVTQKVGKYKAMHNLPIKDLAREKEMFIKRKTLAEKCALNPQMVVKIFRAIIGGVYIGHKSHKKKKLSKKVNLQ